MKTQGSFFPRLVVFTENILTWHKKRRLKIKMKQQSKHWLRDWIEAILWAVCMVLLINQYFFQMYRIPSESMVGTLKIGDVLFVNKLVYGPEAAPGVAKFSGFRKPERSEVIIFENPAYISKGPVFTILQQFTYMITLTFVDIDLDERGMPRPHYLIKRAVGIGGDTIKVKDGEVYFFFKGTDSWISEREYQKKSGFYYPINRLLTEKQYDQIHNAGREAALFGMGLIPGRQGGFNLDMNEYYLNEAEEYALANPHEMYYITAHRRRINGWYVPENRIFPLGDNRDNSQDARWFGAVSLKRVLGHAVFIYWPLNRLGGIY